MAQIYLKKIKLKIVIIFTFVEKTDENQYNQKKNI